MLNLKPVLIFVMFVYLGSVSNTTVRQTEIMSAETKSVRYNDVLSATKHNNIYIIDVREPSEVKEGKIPNSINIPLADVENTLKIFSESQFKDKYGRSKPAVDARIIFSCRSGKRASTALDKALKLGFKNSQFYEGSWLDWEKHNEK